MKTKALLYFTLGALGVVVASHQPVDAWGWVVFLGSVLYQGLLALKAWQSTPEEGKEPMPVNVTNDKSNPVETHQS